MFLVLNAVLLLVKSGQPHPTVQLAVDGYRREPRVCFSRPWGGAVHVLPEAVSLHLHFTGVTSERSPFLRLHFII